MSSRKTCLKDRALEVHDLDSGSVGFLVSREIHAGRSLAGKDSIDASSTMSISCSGLSLSGTGSYLCEVFADFSLSFHLRSPTSTADSNFSCLASDFRMLSTPQSQSQWR